MARSLDRLDRRRLPSFERMARRGRKNGEDTEATLADVVRAIGSVASAQAETNTRLDQTNARLDQTNVRARGRLRSPRRAHRRPQ
jgi:hypothetical protein